jgi:hypothetical protein
MKKVLKRLSQQKISDVRRELGRAHLIIALLSFAAIVLVIQGAVAPVALDKTLSAICSLLLAIVGMTSLVIALALTKIKK